MRKLCFCFLVFCLHGYADESYYMESPRRPGNLRTVPIQILIMDPEDEGALLVTSAYFNNREIYLRPPSPSKIRGKLYADMYPGNYQLRWTVMKNRFDDPEGETFERVIEISPKEIWVDVIIIGEEFEIR